MALIPGFGFIWMLVLGAKGSAWAWRNGRWDSVEHFKRVQRRWAIWGLVIWLAVPVLFGGMIGGVFSPIATSILGSPISTGMPFGGISINGSSGMAELSFSATCPKAAGIVFVEAIKKDGVWSIRRLTLKLNDSGKVIDLINGVMPNTT